MPHTATQTPTAPETLNGCPVIGTGPSKHGYDALTVMVHRKGDRAAPYVVATWSEACGKEWSWGHYCADFAEACASFAELAKVNAGA